MGCGSPEKFRKPANPHIFYILTIILIDISEILRAIYGELANIIVEDVQVPGMKQCKLFHLYARTSADRSPFDCIKLKVSLGILLKRSHYALTSNNKQIFSF